MGECVPPAGVTRCLRAQRRALQRPSAGPCWVTWAVAHSVGEAEEPRGMTCLAPVPPCLQSAHHVSHALLEAGVLCRLLDSLRCGQDRSPSPFPGAGAGSAGSGLQPGAGCGRLGSGATIPAPSNVSPCECAVGREPLSTALSPCPERSVAPALRGLSKLTRPSKAAWVTSVEGGVGRRGSRLVEPGSL